MCRVRGEGHPGDGAGVGGSVSSVNVAESDRIKEFEAGHSFEIQAF